MNPQSIGPQTPIVLPLHQRGSEWGSWDQGFMAKTIPGPGQGPFAQFSMGQGTKAARSQEKFWLGPGTT